MSEIPPATLELLVLKTVALGGPMPVYGIAHFIQATSEDVLKVETQLLYRVLQKMLDAGFLAAEAEAGSGRGRRYRITPAGENRLQRSAAEFRRLTTAVSRMLAIR